MANSETIEPNNLDSETETELADRIIKQILTLYSGHSILPNVVQKQMLMSHVKAMAHRSLTGETLPEVDAGLFEDISPESMQLAETIVDFFGNLPKEEAWLLSVHVEVARNNEK